MAKDMKIDSAKALLAEQEAHKATNKKLEEALLLIESQGGEISGLKDQLRNEQEAHTATKVELKTAAVRIEQLDKAQLVTGELILSSDRDEPQVDEELLAAGLKAYGIERDFLAGAGMDPATGQAVLVTAGGSKVRWPLGDGEQLARLTPVQITGISASARRKPIAGRG